MILLIGHYNETNEIRANEYAECLKRNCEVKCIEAIHRFIEDPAIGNRQSAIGKKEAISSQLSAIGKKEGNQLSATGKKEENTPAESRLPSVFLAGSRLPTANKVVDIQHGHRIFFDELFDYANRYLGGQICIIANSDIFFDESLELLLDYNFGSRQSAIGNQQSANGNRLSARNALSTLAESRKPTADSSVLLALSRWNVQADGTDSISNEWSHCTQDVWIFRSPIKTFPCHWHLGLMQCDQRVVYEAREAGFEVHNPCLSIKASHLHLSGLHTYSTSTIVAGPVDFVEGTALGFSKKRLFVGAQKPVRRIPMTKPLSYYECERLELISNVTVEGKRVLDLGCGAGRMGKVLLERGASEVIGLEKVGRVATLARERLSDVYQYDIESLPTIPYESNHFDFIICGDILEHLVHPGRVLQHFLRWLADDGKVVCSIPNVRHESVILPLLVEGKWQYVESGVLDSTHLRFFTLESIIELLESAQLAVTEPVRTFKTEPTAQFSQLCALVATLGVDLEKFREQTLTLQYFVTAQKRSAIGNQQSALSQKLKNCLADS